MVAEETVNFEMRLAIGSDFLYFEDLDILDQENGFRIPFSERGELLKFAEYFIVPFMGIDFGVYFCSLDKVAFLDACSAMILKSLDQFI